MGLEFLDKYAATTQLTTFQEWQPSLVPESQLPPVLPTPPPAPVREFSQKAWRGELVKILDGLFWDNNTARAVQRVRAEGVPVAMQDGEFLDILTRAVETTNGTVRRKMIAFAVGLAAGQPSAFSRDQCAKGLASFLSEVCPDMRAEVPKMTSILCSEMLPTLRTVFTPDELDQHLPTFVKDNLNRADAQLRRRHR